MKRPTTVWIWRIWLKSTRYSLFDRNLIQVASRRSDGGVKTCHIHDLLRDLAISEAKKDDVNLLKALPNLKKLKAYCSNNQIEIFEYLSKLERLQILNIEGRFKFTNPGALPLSLTKMMLSATYLDTSPFGKLGGLPNLQVLKLQLDSLMGRKLEYDSNQGQFPRFEVLHIHYLGIERWSMEGQGLQSLVYLSIGNCSKLKSIPVESNQFQTWVNDPRLHL